MITYQEATAFLFQQFPQYQKVGAGAYKPGLDGMRALACWLDNPQDHFKSIHIAGTNGKGSVAHMLAAVFQSAGYKTGLYTSPHLVDFRERIKINGKLIPASRVTAFVERYKKEYAHRVEDQSVNCPPSFFEITTALAFDFFAQEKVDIAVIETGLGGLLDSTNILPASLSQACVITNIGLEHCDMLGPTIDAIAVQKAGIIKEGVPVVIGEFHSLSFPVFRQQAALKKAPLHCAWERLRDDQTEYLLAHMDLQGCYQEHNLAAVLSVLDILCAQGWRVSSEAILHAAALTSLHGRWETLSLNPKVIVDTAHNAHGLQYLPRHLQREHYDHLYLIMGVVAEKDLEPIWQYLPHDATYLFSQAQIARALPAFSLAEKAAAQGFFGDVFPTISEAFIKAKELANPGDLILITGSTFTVAEILENFFCENKK